MDYIAEARRRWPHADLYGAGRWAVPSCGGGREVSLRASREQALVLKAALDRDGCGRHCRGAHEVLELVEEAPPVG
jgi:hypothetical protein